MKSTTFENLKEDINHGTILLPFQYYRCVFSEDYSFLPLHWHEEAEITLILEGSAIYTIDFETYEVEKGDLLFISPHVLHSAQIASGQKLVSDTFVFHLDMVINKTMDSCSMKYLIPLQNGSYHFPPILKSKDPGYEDLISCMKEMYSIYQDAGYGYELMLKYNLYKIFYLLHSNNLITQKNTPGIPNQAEEKLKSILQYIENHYNEELTIQQLADLCHFSKCHFMNFFKKYVGVTCMEYIIDYRLNVIASKLIHYTGNITDLVMNAGFNNISYFNRVFKRKYGTTPKKYMANLKHYDYFMKPHRLLKQTKNGSYPMT